MITIFGISNCDTVRKTKKWFSTNGVSFEFHDFRKDGLSESLIAQWLDQVELSVLVNRRSTTWKQLTDTEKSDIDSGNAIAILTQYPTLVKRPVVSTGESIIIGYNEQQFHSLK